MNSVALSIFQSRFPDWEYDDNIKLYVDHGCNIRMTGEDINSNSEKSKKEIMAWQDEAMKYYTINSVVDKITEDKGFGMRFVEHKMMQDQLVWNYDKKSWSKVLPAIDYIAECVSDKTGKDTAEIISELDVFIASNLWYNIRERKERESFKKKLEDLIYFHYNYNTVEDIKEALIKHKWIGGKEQKKEERKKDCINVWNEHIWDVFVSVYDAKKALQEYDILSNT